MWKPAKAASPSLENPQSAPLALSLETPCFCWRLPSDKAAVNSCVCVCARGGESWRGGRERERKEGAERRTHRGE